YKDIEVSIEHFLGPGLYAEFGNDRNISFSRVKEIESKMLEIVEKDYSIVRTECSIDEAINIFKKAGYDDKVRLLKSIDKEKASIYNINGHVDSFHGYLAPSTGFVKNFK